jgi:hypothetical protein
MDFAKINSLQSKAVSLVTNLQPGRPDLCFYIPQRQGGSVKPPGTRVPFSSPFTTRRGGGILTRLNPGHFYVILSLAGGTRDEKMGF